MHALWAPHRAAWGPWSFVLWRDEVVGPLRGPVPVVPARDGRLDGYLVPEVVVEILLGHYLGGLSMPEGAAEVAALTVAVGTAAVRTIYVLGGAEAVWRAADAVEAS